ncbi:MAG: DUF6198 family protein [Rikenellaceae bacterium]
MSVKELIHRYLVFVLGLIIMSMGVAVITYSYLGTSPISSTPYVFSLNTRWSMGTYLFFLGIFLVIVQVCIMGWAKSRERYKELLLQIPSTMLFGIFTDISMWMLTGFAPEDYYMKILTLVAGSFILALGVAIQVEANVTMMGGEYTVRVIAEQMNKRFGDIKMFFDSALVILAVSISLVFSSNIQGVREGTIIAAVITGPFVRVISPRLGFLTNRYKK